MRKLGLFVGIATFAAVLFFTGWYFGSRGGVKLGSDLLKAQMFGQAYTQLTESEVVIEQLNSNQTEGAKRMLYQIQDGNIFALAAYIEPSYTRADISLVDMKILLKIWEQNLTQTGPQKDAADKIIARVAKFRAAHPWTYNGKLTNGADAEIEAKLAAILKRASESQK